MNSVPSVRWVVLSTALAGIMGFLTVLLYFPHFNLNWGTLTWLVVITTLAEFAHITVRHGRISEEFTFTDITIVVGTLLLYPAVEVLVVTLAVLLVSVIRRRPFLKAVFNIFSHAISTVAMVSVFHLFAGPDHASLHTPFSHPVQDLMGITLGMMAFTLVNQSTFVRLLSALSGEKVRLRPRLRTAFSAGVASVVVGTTTVSLLHSSPVLLPFAVIAGAVLTYIQVSSAQESRSEEKAARLLSVSSLLSTRLGANELLPSFLALVKEAFPVSSVVVMLNEQGIVYVTERKDNEDFLERVATAEDLRLYETAQLYKRATLLQSGGLNNKVIVMPLSLQKGSKGVVALVAKKSLKKTLSSQDTFLLEPLAESLKAALDNSSLFEHVQAITASQREAVIALGYDGVITFANPAACRMLSLPVNATNMAFPDAVIKTQACTQTIPELLLKAKVNRFLQDDDADLIFKNGKVIPVSYTLTPIVDSTEVVKPANSLVLVLQDITQRRHDQEKILASQAQLVELGSTLQQSLLPPHLPDIPFVKSAARYHSGSEGLEVGGDFYDLFSTVDKKWVAVLGDVCGRGPKAAALTALTRYTVRASATSGASPSKILDTLNDAILKYHGDDRFCTVITADLKIESGSLRASIACGGHPPAIVLRKNKDMQKIGPAGTLLGVFDTIRVQEEEVVLFPGDSILFYTDGVLEARNAAGDFFEGSFFDETLVSMSGQTAEIGAKILDEALMSFQGGSLSDDTAFLLLSVD